MPVAGAYAHTPVASRSRLYHASALVLSRTPAHECPAKLLNPFLKCRDTAVLAPVAPFHNIRAQYRRFACESRGCPDMAGTPARAHGQGAFHGMAHSLPNA